MPRTNWCGCKLHARVQSKTEANRVRSEIGYRMQRFKRLANGFHVKRLCDGGTPCEDVCVDSDTLQNSKMKTELSAVVVGIGSDHGDDSVAWDVVSRLRGVESRVTSDPLFVADLPPGCPLLIVVDACHGAGPPGSVHRFLWPDSRFADRRIMSSHGWGLADGLHLAETLRRLPTRVVVFAIETVSVEPGAALSPEVAAAIPDVVERIRNEIRDEP